MTSGLNIFLYIFRVECNLSQFMPNSQVNFKTFCILRVATELFDDAVSCKDVCGTRMTTVLNKDCGR